MKYDVIFSTNDRGLVPGINYGMSQAVYAGFINSAVIFVNYLNFKDLIDKFIDKRRDNTPDIVFKNDFNAMASKTLEEFFGCLSR